MGCKGDMLVVHLQFSKFNRWRISLLVVKQKLKLVEELRAHAQYCNPGDATLDGTKLAVEDALALAACLQEQPDTAGALAAYEEERRPVVASTQRAPCAPCRSSCGCSARGAAGGRAREARGGMEAAAAALSVLGNVT